MSDSERFHHGRHAGILVPLFSIPSRGSWGIGEIPDLSRFARWAGEAGLDFVQLLPVNEMEEGQNSPYSALSAMAIDPIYIAPGEVPEFAESGGEAGLDPRDRDILERVRGNATVDYRAVRGVKRVALHAAFAVFRERHRGGGCDRARAFSGYVDREGWWLDDYVLFRALHDEHQGAYWHEWAPGLRNREPTALEDARRRLAERILFYQYLQWLADEQWSRARQQCGRIGLFGDFPFMVSGHSADVWARQHEFRTDASVGVPPDATSETGQDWGLPPYRWDVMAPGGYEWIRQRARRSAALYDGFRIDHLVGFYRTYVRERDGRASFTPPDEPSQLAQGERLMRLFQETGARIIAEDLGTVPDFVRESLDRLHLPGLKVLRWEREWHQEGHPFRPPSSYLPASVAITGTHDTETLAEWWNTAGSDERRRCAEVVPLREAGASPDDAFSPVIRDVLLRAIFSAGSDLVILPVQDVFGWTDRINTPSVVNEENWTWRLPWPSDTLLVQPDAQERRVFLRALSREFDRSH